MEGKKMDQVMKIGERRTKHGMKFGNAESKVDLETVVWNGAEANQERYQ
jgi:hypothetical protein